MILDLEDPSCPPSLDCDICIIGGGTAGCYLAHRLEQQHRNVVVLEAGGSTSSFGEGLGFDPANEGTRYGGVYEGRAFGLGGTSAKWGGLLIAYGETDCLPASEKETWRHIVSTVQRHKRTARKALGLNSAEDCETRPMKMLGEAHGELSKVRIQTLASEMLSFRTRNLSRLIPKASKSLQVVLHAVASEWSVANGSEKDKSARVNSVTAVSRSGRRLIVRAREFVIASGTIESARILLDIDDQTRGQALLARDQVGRFLSDHLSVQIGSIDPADTRKAIRIFGPRFDGSLMKAIRMIDTESLSTLPRHFAHPAFHIQDAGFALAKKVLFALQARQFPSITLSESWEGLVGLTALGFDRFARSRLHVPESTPIALQLDVEQEPKAENSVALLDTRDEYGRRRAKVTWQVGDNDRRNIAALQAAILKKWNSLGTKLPRVIPVDPHAEGKLHDAYHPVGVCRMGVTNSSVLSGELRVRGLSNTSVLSTAIFPSAGSANPTFSLLCFAEELAARL